MNVDTLESVLEKTYEFQALFSELESRHEFENEVRKYIKNLPNNNLDAIPEFEDGLQWFNVSSPLSMKNDLQGKLVLLDFFTYCCINCMHILPDLHFLEHEYSCKDGLVVIGVHSAKFDNEKASSNVLNAVLRYGITHPVVNDNNMMLWDSMGVRCWPTLVLLSPKGEMLLMLMGEGHRELLTSFIKVALDVYHETDNISEHEISLKLVKDSLPPTSLLYPGKVVLNGEETQLALTDTGHHRILVLDVSGDVQHVIGGKNPGYKDGLFSECKFFNPQGICWYGNDVIFVADTDNHLIRKIDLLTSLVTTIAGTGVQGNDKEGGLNGTSQSISSPWDLLINTSEGFPYPDSLFVAMAGTHQIWMFCLNDITWWKKKELSKNSCLCIAGSGLEENRNNSYPLRAAFAQPSGLALSSNIHVKTGEKEWILYIADSESSSVRALSLTDGCVKGVVGGASDPRNLFAFGDQDGKSTEARLQHPLSVSTSSSDLYVADSYNHKIKLIDPSMRTIRTIAGSSQPGDALGDLKSSKFNEIGGITCSFESGLIYVADTNNHCIKVCDVKSDNVSKLNLQFPPCEPKLVAQKNAIIGDKPPRIPKNVTRLKLNPVESSVDGEISFRLDLQLSSDLKLTDGANSSWTLWTEPYTGKMQSGTFTSLNDQPKIVFKPCAENVESYQIFIIYTIYYCNGDGACKMAAVLFEIPGRINSNENNLKGEQVLHHLIEK